MRDCRKCDLFYIEHMKGKKAWGNIMIPGNHLYSKRGSFVSLCGKFPEIKIR